MKKWILLLISLCLALALCACGEKEPENIVEDLEGPEGIDLFAGLWYHEEADLWVEIYYDGAWCTFEEGGILRSYGSLTIENRTATLEPKEGEDKLILTAGDGKLTDPENVALFQVTEVGVRKPLIVNDLGVPDTLSSDTKAEGDVDPSFVETYAGFYISEDGIYALELFADGGYEIQEYGLITEKGSVLRLTEPERGQLYAVATEGKAHRLLLAQEERLYVGGIGTFAPGEKGIASDE
ncbi:MAG: hypothetical protein IKM59_01090 [Oscillospiraceae bacterium]|nr:hypothetical protein [Oscillospiraceae bacterium]